MSSPLARQVAAEVRRPSVPLTIHCIAALMYAKERLAQNAEELHRADKNKCICFALGNAARKHPTWGVAVDYLSSVIRARLNGHTVLEVWLFKNVPDARDLLMRDGAAFRDKTQATRHAWVDSLIEELETGKL